MHKRERISNLTPTVPLAGVDPALGAHAELVLGEADVEAAEAVVAVVLRADGQLGLDEGAGPAVGVVGVGRAPPGDGAGEVGVGPVQ